MQKKLSSFITEYRCWFKEEESKHKKILERRIEKRFIEPLLMKLGYSSTDIRKQVVVDLFAGSGSSIGKGKVDYVIIDPPYVQLNNYSRQSLGMYYNPVGIIEAKRSNVSIDNDSWAHHQIISYKNTPQLKNVKWLILTNGRKINFYSSLNEFQAIQINIIDGSILELVKTLNKLGKKKMARFIEQMPEMQKRLLEKCFKFNPKIIATVF